MKTHYRILGLQLSLMASAFALAISGSAEAAVQGVAGVTSTGSVTINASVSPRVDITGLADITFADADLGPVINTSNQATKAANVCVWSNNPDKSYYITASGSGTSSAFTLANSTNPTIPYEVYWSATTGQTSGTALTAGTKSAKLTSTATAPTCGSGTTASLIVGIQGSDANSMLASTAYTGVLTLLVTPN